MRSRSVHGGPAGQHSDILEDGQSRSVHGGTAPGVLCVHVVTHTHWDREWYLPAGRVRQRLVSLVDDLLAREPVAGESFLLDGQAIVLEDYLGVRPEQRGAMAARLAGGALEAGPWYVLADELIPCGEALVRNLLAGSAVLRALGATSPPVLYSPDAFGHPATLPALAAGFGCEVIILWRGVGGPAWPAGDVMRWAAPDGSTALLYHLPPDGYELGANLPRDAAAAHERWKHLCAVLEPRATLGLTLLLNGADHHARQPALDRAMAALARAAAPEAIVRSTLSAFAAELVRVASSAVGERIPRISGELRGSYGYTWTLQGTLGTRSALKRRNAAAERLLVRDAEPWVALAARRNGASRVPLAWAAWKALLQCHPHDTLCGCARDDVARAMAARLDDAIAQAEGLRDDAVADLIGHDPAAARGGAREWRSAVVVRNAAARPRSGVAELEVLLFREHVRVGPGSAPPPPTRLTNQDDGSPGDTVEPGSAFYLGGGTVPVQLLESALRHDRIESPVHYPHDDLVLAVRAMAWVNEIAGYGTHALPLECGTHALPLEEPAIAAAECNARTPAVPNAVSAGCNWLDNGLLRVDVAQDGTACLSAVNASVVVPSLLSLEDVGDAGDLYTHSPVGPTITAAAVEGAHLVHSGPLRGEIAAIWQLQLPGSTTRAGRGGATVPMAVRVTLSLDAAAPFLRIRVEGENRARDHRLRLVLRTGIANPSVHADAAFGPVRREHTVAPYAGAPHGGEAQGAGARGGEPYGSEPRGSEPRGSGPRGGAPQAGPPHAGPPRDGAEVPVPTAPLARYVTLSDAERGATVYSDGLAEYEALADGSVAITLLRSVGELSRNDLPERPGHAGWPLPVPEAQELGSRFEGSFAILLHGARDEPCRQLVERVADDVLLPLRGVTMRSLLALPEPTRGVELEGEGLAFSACKESEDGAWTVLRCVNLLEREVAGQWCLGAPIREACSARLDETPGEPLAVAADTVAFLASARTISTVLVR